MLWSLVLLFCTQLVALFFISRISIKYLFYLFHRILSHDKVVYLLIAAIFLPGTILHELSHFAMAIVLLLKVRELHIFPQMENGYIKLGRVIYEKKDVVRSIIVGIAPIILGLLFFWWLSIVDVLSTHNVWIKIIVIYIIFVISTTMFSSKQDLIDLVYILPIIMIGGIIFYFFPIDISFITKQTILIEGTYKFLYDVNNYLFISLIIHIVLISILFLITRSSSRND